jgi:ABC-type nitrate/sulfonate/bicarbonate transport system substrate-binding protein
MTQALVMSLLALALGARATADVIVVGHTRASATEGIAYLKSVARSSGLEIEERILPSDAALVSSLLQGEIEVAIGAPELAIAARGHGAPILVVSGFSQSHERILARRQLHAEHVADLAHRRVGVPRGGSLELLLLSELRAAKLTWSDGRDRDVQLVYLAAADLDAALRSGYVDAVVQSDALATRAVRTGYAVEIPLARGSRLDALLTTEHVYGERRALARLVRSVVDAARVLEAHQQLAARGAWSSAIERDLWSNEYRGVLSQTPIAYRIQPGYVDDTARRMVELGVGGPYTGAGLVPQLVKLDLLEEIAGRAGRE